MVNHGQQPRITFSSTTTRGITSRNPPCHGKNRSAIPNFSSPSGTQTWLAGKSKIFIDFNNDNDFPFQTSITYNIDIYISLSLPFFRDFPAIMEVRAPKECVGVARIPVVFLESIACTTATRVGAT